MRFNEARRRSHCAVLCRANKKIPWCLECLGKRDLIPFCMLTAAARAKGRRKRRHYRKRTTGGIQRGHTYLQLQKKLFLLPKCCQIRAETTWDSQVSRPSNARTFGALLSTCTTGEGQVAVGWMEETNLIDFTRALTGNWREFIKSLESRKSAISHDPLAHFLSPVPRHQSVRSASVCQDLKTHRWQTGVALYCARIHVVGLLPLKQTTPRPEIMHEITLRRTAEGKRS